MTSHHLANAQVIKQARFAHMHVYSPSLYHKAVPMHWPWIACTDMACILKLHAVGRALHTDCDPCMCLPALLCDRQWSGMACEAAAWHHAAPSCPQLLAAAACPPAIVHAILGARLLHSKVEFIGIAFLGFTPQGLHAHAYS